MSDISPSLPPTPGQFTPPGEKKSGLPGWAIALIAVIGGLVVLCAVAAVVGIGMLTMLGSRVSEVFTTIETQMDDLPADAGTTSAPLGTTDARPIGERATTGGMEFVVLRAGPLETDSSTLPPDKGMIYYSVEIEARNTSGDVAILSAFNSQMQDDSENIYAVSLFGQSSTAISSDELFQTLEKGVSATVTYVYEVPSETTSLFWVYQNSSEDYVVYKVK